MLKITCDFYRKDESRLFTLQVGSCCWTIPIYLRLDQGIWAGRPAQIRSAVIHYKGNRGIHGQYARASLVNQTPPIRRRPFICDIMHRRDRERTTNSLRQNFTINCDGVRQANLAPTISTSFPVQDMMRDKALSIM